LHKKQLPSQGGGHLFSVSLSFSIKFWIRVGKIAFSNPLPLIMEWRLSSAFKGKMLTPRGDIELQKARAKSGTVARGP
jgi:hypothetical protein